MPSQQDGRRAATSLNPHESVRKQLRRAARQHLARARKACEGEGAIADRVHEVRTSLKKARSLLRLAGPSMPRRRYEREAAELRETAAVLSDLRDAEVRPQTLAQVLAAADPETRIACAAFAHALDSERARVVERLTRDDTLDRLRRRLRRSRRRAAGWRIGPRGWRAIGPGLVRGGKRARKALAHAYADGSDDAFHELRKAVKSHAHHMRFVETLSPAWHARRKQLDHAADALGRDHDLAVLRALVCDHPLVPPGVRGRIDAVAVRLQTSLRSALRPQLERLFAERPRVLERAIRRAWRDLRGAGQTRSSAEPQVKPAPKAAKHTRSPGATSPRSRASSNASGIDAAVVLP